MYSLLNMFIEFFLEKEKIRDEIMGERITKLHNVGNFFSSMDNTSFLSRITFIKKICR